MELLLFVGSFLLWALLKILLTAMYAVPAGFGLGCGFYLWKRITKRNYLKQLEEEQLGGAVTAGAKA